jgi:hypothetical protein
MRTGHSSIAYWMNAHRLAVVVVARNEIQRHLERREQSAQVGVFLRAPVLHQVAADEQHVGPLRQPQDALHRAPQHGGAIHPPVRQLTRRRYVQVADLAGEKAG